MLINGSAKGVGALAGVVRRLQTGQLYWYALVPLHTIVFRTMTRNICAGAKRGD